MTAGCPETTTADMVDRCEGPALPPETAPQRNGSSSVSKSPSSTRRTIILNVGGECRPHQAGYCGLSQRFVCR